jgi:subtilisin family serine protease
MWNLAKILWARARAAQGFRDADEINVAVLDTGVDTTHPDLQGRVSKYVYLHPDTNVVSGQKDIVGHGTHVAGIIGALIGNGAGINGICNCHLNVWKIFPDQTQYSPEENEFAYFVDPVMYRRALADCLDENIDVINLSIGGPGEPDHQELQLFNALMARGTTIVAAMGNERQEGSPTSYPAAILGVIGVGATGLNDRVTNFSNRGDHITVCAPGKSIWSTLPTYSGQFGFSANLVGNRPVEGKEMSRETDYDAWDGTSMASPHVAAAAALLIAKEGRNGPTAVKNQLSRKSDAVPAMGNKPFDSDYGFGRLNLLRLLN